MPLPWIVVFVLGFVGFFSVGLFLSYFLFSLKTHSTPISFSSSKFSW